MAGHTGRLTQGLPGLEMTPGLQDTDVQRVLRFKLIITGDIWLKLVLIVAIVSIERNGQPNLPRTVQVYW